ncbi:MAG: ABC transporter permease [Candidatus Tectomicrobia bacterium]|nr:ABC transporter permease [Candidatus Tectomicrobia bacterium]
MDFDLIISIFQAAVRSGTPILFACVGEIYAERSGVLNLGVEGMMLMGAIAGFFTSFLTQSAVAGVAAAAVMGALVAVIHAYVTITLRADQIVSGLTLTLLGTGMSGFFGQPMIGRVAPGFNALPLPGLSQIPHIGRILFQQDALVYFSYLLVPLTWFVLFKMRLGLSIRSVGENPETADSLGVRVVGFRYGCVLFGGALAGIGGAYLSLAYTTMWIEQMTSGRGWIAIALVIFAAWNPLRAFLGAYLFGGADALQLRIQAVGSAVPAHFLMMLPYVLTIGILILATRESVRRRFGAPEALGIPYAREERMR